MTTKGDFLPKPRYTIHKDGSATERRVDGRQFIWYPRGERLTVRFVVPACCPCCGRALNTATVDEELAI